jgi:predicted permease
MLRSFLKLQQVDTGFNPERVMVVRVNPNWWKYTREQYRDFYRRVIEKVKTQPGVLATAISSSYPLRTSINRPSNRDLNIEGRPHADNQPPPRVDVRYASPDFFSTIGLPLVNGRLFTEADRHGAPFVVLINQKMAHHYWSNEEPLGKRISLDRGQTWATVVGVVGDVRQYGSEKDQTDAVYGTVDQALVRPGYLLVRTAGEPTNLISQVRTVVHEIDSETVVDQTTTLEQAHREALASPRLTTLLITIFALIALMITAAGIAGVMALSVNQRKHELGIRLALGATPQGVLWMVLRQGMVSTLVGLAIGSLAAFALTRMLRTLLFEVEPTDPLTFLAIAWVLGGIALLSCLVPARRVTSIDPMATLRSE